MPHVVLPKISSNPDIDYSQGKLIRVFQQFVSTYNPPGELPFNTADGVCSGLVDNWLYRKRIGEEELFINRLEFALEWTPELQDSHSQVVAELMNDINFFQHDHKLRDGISQDSAASFDYVLPKHYSRVLPIEFAISFVFNLKSLTQLITDTVHENKMVRFGNGFHRIGLMYTGDQYYVYDPFVRSGPVAFADNEQESVAATIMAGLSKLCKSIKNIAIYMSISDIADNPVLTQYPDALDYCRALLADSQYKHAVLTHPNILHLNMRYNNYKFQDLLFPDYKYVPWILTKETEYDEAIIANNSETVRYLAAHGIPLDYKGPSISSMQPVIRAIFLDRMDMLYLLLKLGANPNVTDESAPPRLKYVIRTSNIQALILLLAAGMDLSEDDMKQVIDHFKLSSSQLYAMTAHVLLLHAKMFDKPLPMASILLKKLDIFVRKRTKESELTEEHKLEMASMLDTLQQVAAVPCDVTERVKIAQDKISQYVTPKPSAVVFSNKTPSAVDFERDVRPLLNLSFN